MNGRPIFVFITNQHRLNGLNNHKKLIMRNILLLFTTLFMCNCTWAQRVKQDLECVPGATVRFPVKPERYEGPNGYVTMFMAANAPIIVSAICSNFGDTFNTDSVILIEGIDANVYRFCEQQGGIPEVLSIEKKGKLKTLHFKYYPSFEYQDREAVVYGVWVYVGGTSAIALQFSCPKEDEDSYSKMRKRFFSSRKIPK